MASRYDQSTKLVKSKASSASPAKRKHRRSYTISAPYEFRTVYKATPDSAWSSPAQPTPVDRLNDDRRSLIDVPTLPELEMDDNLTGTARTSRYPASDTKLTAKEALCSSTQAPLPSTWGIEHDRAICSLNMEDVPLPVMVSKMKKTFPHLHGVLTASMINKRLRILDQRLDVEYWRMDTAVQDRAGTTQTKNNDLENVEPKVTALPSLVGASHGLDHFSDHKVDSSSTSPAHPRPATKQARTPLKSMFSRLNEVKPRSKS